MAYNPRTAGERLRHFRWDVHSLTQQELGRRVGASQPSISFYEKGRIPNRHMRRRIAEVLGCHPSYLWTDADLYPDEAA